MAAPTPDETWPLTGTYSFKGIKATGQAWVFRGKGNNTVTNPVIIAEGFPGGQSLDALWKAFNTSNFASTLLSLGFDVIFLGYIAPTQNSPTYVEANAAVAIACVQKAIAAAPNAKLAVGGASMGGLVTRYALASMEQNKIAHNTSLYFSFDTPHLGASIPASVLYFVNFFAAKDPKDPDLQAIFNLLQSPAAQEMLLYWLGPYPGSGKPWQPPAVSSLRTDFLKNLTGLGNKGFPAQPYLVGVFEWKRERHRECDAAVRKSPHMELQGRRPDRRNALLGYRDCYAARQYRRHHKGGSICRTNIHLELQLKRKRECAV
jgi:hypothetical protein